MPDLIASEAGDLRVEALRSAVRGPFTATFPAGGVSVISGPSGAGKSVFLRMIADLDPNEGSASVGAIKRAAVPAPRWRRLVTYLPAESGWWAETPGQHMADPVRARALFADFGLDPALLGVPVTRLSTGERQRAALVRAMVNGPRFLLLDEPTAALDPGAKMLVEAGLTRFAAEGGGLVMVTHDADQADRIATRRFTMHPDRLEEIR